MIPLCDRFAQECDATLKHKVELLSKLESQKDEMTAAIAQLEQKYAPISQSTRSATSFSHTEKKKRSSNPHHPNKSRYIAEMAGQTQQRDASAQLAVQLADGEQRCARAETQLRIEHEWRSALQATERTCNEQIAAQQTEIGRLRDAQQQHERVRGELERVRQQWQEAQQTLEELGIQLSVSKLQVSELQDAKRTTTKAAAAAATKGSAAAGLEAAGKDGSDGALGAPADSGQWTPDEMCTHCRGCNREFGITRRKVHGMPSEFEAFLVNHSYFFGSVHSAARAAPLPQLR